VSDVRYGQRPDAGSGTDLQALVGIYVMALAVAERKEHALAHVVAHKQERIEELEGTARPARTRSAVRK
jgi:hypothetical protein